MRPFSYDEAALVVVAAHAIGVEPTTVLDTADVAALVSVAELSEDADATEAAASVLVEIVRRRPFLSGNAAAATLAALVLLKSRDHPVECSHDALLSLVRAVERGQAETPDIAALFRPTGSGDQPAPLWGSALVGPTTEDVPLFLALTTATTIAFVPAGATYSVRAIGRLGPADLTGEWSLLSRMGEHIGSVPMSAIELDVEAGAVDWQRLVAALPGLAGMTWLPVTHPPAVADPLDAREASLVALSRRIDDLRDRGRRAPFPSLFDLVLAG